jgi:hypothetical protein
MYVKGVNLISILRAAFSYDGQTNSFSVIAVQVLKQLFVRLSYEKAARKMFVKLTLGVFVLRYCFCK